MGWRIENDMVLDKNGLIVCFFLPFNNSFYRRMIQKLPEDLELIGDFLFTYDEGKKMSKKLFDQFSLLLHKGKTYNMEWDFDQQGNLADEKNDSVCLFTENRLNASLIKNAPEIFKTIQTCVENFNNSGTAKQKNIYLRFCDIHDSITDPS